MLFNTEQIPAVYLVIANGARILQCGDISVRTFQCGHFSVWTFQCVDTSVRGHFSAGTLQYLDILVRGHFSAWTFQCVTISVRGLLSVPPVFLPVSEGFQNARGCVTVLRYVADQKQNNNKSRDSQSVLLSGSKGCQ